MAHTVCNVFEQLFFLLKVQRLENLQYLSNHRKSYLSEIESGAKNVSLELVNRYAEFFEIQPSGILFVGESLARRGIAKSFEKSFSGKIRSLMTWISDVDAAKGEDIEKV